MTTEIDLGAELYGGNRGFAASSIGSRSGSSSMRHGTAQEASDNKRVKVLMDGSDAPITISCDVPVAKFQRVSVASSGGTYKVVSVGQVLEIAEQAAAVAQEAKSSSGEAEAQVALVKEDVKEAKEAATAAQAAANEAKSESAEAVSASASATAAANQAKQSADAASASASAAAKQAADADSKAEAAVETANAASEEAAAIEKEIGDVKADAASMRADLEGQIEIVTETMEESYAKKTEVEEVETTLRSEMTESVAGITNTFEQEYAKKTALTEVESSLQTQITQNAGQISSVASSVTEVKTDVTSVQTKADAAQDAANKAQATANAASASASSAQKAADNAASAASTAQGKADEAKQAAEDAQGAADTAAANLAKAEEELESVKNRVGATEEDIKAAEQAVEDAKKAAGAAQADADTAKAAAEAAQGTANTAKADAATAQSTADKAKADAATAKKAADDAQDAAEAAQEGVNNLAPRVTAAETAIKQNSEAITLSATKTEELSSSVDGSVASVIRYYTLSDTKPRVPAENPPAGGGGPSSITWDGDITKSEEYGDFYKVSSFIPSISDVIGQAVTAVYPDGTLWRKFVVTEDMIIDCTDSSTGPYFEVADAIKVELEGHGSVQAGTYFFRNDEGYISELTLDGLAVWSAKEPSGGPSSITWDGDTTGLDCYDLQDGGTYYKVHDGEVPESSQIVGQTMTFRIYVDESIAEYVGFPAGETLISEEIVQEYMNDLPGYYEVYGGAGTIIFVTADSIEYGWESDTVTLTYGIYFSYMDYTADFGATFLGYVSELTLPGGGGSGSGSLYYVDCTTYMDGSFSYSEVNKSSAKDAADAVKKDLATNYYTKTETDAQIQVKADAITSTVTSLQNDLTTNYATKSEVTQTAEGITVELSKSISAADTKAGNAATAAANAAKTATDYLSFTSNGLVVGDMKNGTLKGNVLIDSDSVDVRNGTTVLATFDATKARVGTEDGQNVTVSTDGLALNNEGIAEFDVSYDDDCVTVSTGDRKKRLVLMNDWGYCSFDIAEYQATFSHVPGGGLFLKGGGYKGSARVTGFYELYSNASGSSGTVELSESVAKFKFIEIQYTDGTRTLTRRVYSPDGKTVSIDRMVYGGNVFYMGAMVLTISGNSIMRVTDNCGIASINASGNAVSAESAQLPITAVIGYV